MKTGLPDVSARIASSADVGTRPKRPFLRRFGFAGAIVATGALLLLFARHAILGLVLTSGLSLLTGDRIAIGEFHIGVGRAAVSELHVTTAAGDPLLDVKRVGVAYSLADWWRPGVRRFGLRSLEIERPVFSLVRHADGSYNLGSGAHGGAGGGSSGAPWHLVVRVRNGELRLLDRAPVAPDLADQRISDVRLDARIDSAAHSRVSAGAQFFGRQSELVPIRGYPLHVGATIDYRRGVALIRMTAPLLPARGGLGFLLHGGAVRVDDGVFRHLALSLYGLGIVPGGPLGLTIGGSADLAGGRLRIAALARPIRDIRGRITLLSDGVWTTRLDARAGRIPLVARGGIFNRAHPTLRLGVSADGDLRDLRGLFAFSRRTPVAGAVHVETLLEAPTANLLIRSALHVDHGAYGNVPLSAVRGRVDYHAGAVVLDGISGRYGTLAIGVGGRFLLGRRALDSAIVGSATAAAGTLPYAENLAPDTTVDGLTLISSGPAGFRANGSIGLRGAETAGGGTFSVNERGVGEFGPFVFTRRDGSSLIGALRLERPISRSAAWVSARRFRVTVPKIAARLAGLSVPAFPPVAGVIDGELAGAGSPGAFGLDGYLRGRELRVGSASLGTGHVALGGSLTDVRLEALGLAGPLGQFTGNAALARGTLALDGAYTGSLDQLVPLTGNQEAHGRVRGAILAALTGPDVVVQSSGATLHGGTVRGVTLDRAAGTIAVRNGRFHLLAGEGFIMGRRAVAAESHGTIAVSAPDIPSAALSGTGLPLDAGNVSTYGVADLRDGSLRFNGTVAVASGRARGFNLGGDARIELADSRARISVATGALGSTYGSIAGSITGVGERALHFDLDARVRLGDLDLLRRDLHLPVRNLAGTFTAGLRVHGSGTRPFVDGRLTAPEGVYNGLAFRAGTTRIAIDPAGVAARAGQLTIGSTTAAIEASVAGGVFGFAARSAAANLADFNDFFDRDDTLAGRGRVDLAVSNAGDHFATHGALGLQGLRFRDFPIGTASAAWTMRGRSIVGHGVVTSPVGRLGLAASILPARSGAASQAFRGATYTARATVDRLDLATVFRPLGLHLPVRGFAGGRISLAGRFPALAVGVDANLVDGEIGAIPVQAAHLHARSVGSRITVSASDADLGFATLAASGRLGLADRDPLEFDLRVASPDVGAALRASVPAARSVIVAGTLAADVRLGGTRGAPKIAGGFDLTNARYAGFTVPRAVGSLAFSGGAFEVRDADLELTRGQLIVAGSLPLLLRPLVLGPARAPVSFDVTARGVDLAQFAPLLPAGTKIAGMLDGDFGVEGSVAQPRLFGSVALSGGSYTSPFERAPVTGVEARLRFSGKQVSLATFHADVGGGTLDGGGDFTLPFETRGQPTYQAQLIAKSAKLDFPAYGRGTLDGSLALSSSRGQPLVTGDVALRDAVVPVSAVYGGSSTVAGEADALKLDPAFRIHAAAGENVRLRSAIVDIGVTGGVDLSGTLRRPLLAGGFSATDGTISSYNHVFRIVNAAVSFNPADGAIPTVDARAFSRVTNPDPDPSRNIAGSANIIVTVSGTADNNNLQVTYSSDPAYSQEQIIGLLLDVPALLGAVNFNLNGGPSTTLLRNVPGETNALLPPGVTPEQVSAVSFNQEVFSLLSGQFTQRALTPIERVFEKTLGLSDVEFTVDYGGGLGYSLRRQIGKRDFYAFLSQTVTYPERSNIGFELEPKPFQTINFSYYEQNGVTSLITNQTPGQEVFSSTGRLTSVQPLGDRSGFSLNYSRRF